MTISNSESAGKNRTVKLLAHLVSPEIPIGGVPGRPGMDRVRQSPGPSKSPELEYLDEAFTSENWIVRIYAVKKPDALGRDLPSVKGFEGGKRRKRAVGLPAPSAGAKKK